MTGEVLRCVALTKRYGAILAPTGSTCAAHRRSRMPLFEMNLEQLCDRVAALRFRRMDVR